MKLDGVVPHSGVDGEEKVEECRKSPPPPALVVVGYALTSKKKKSFLQPNLITLARSKGIQFVPIDQTRFLSEQGPFDIVLHKFTGKEWSQVIELCLLGYHVAALMIRVEQNYLIVSQDSLVASMPICIGLDTLDVVIQSKFDLKEKMVQELPSPQNILEYQREHPKVIVLDPPNAIRHVHNRQSMLEHVADLKLPDSYGKVCVPKQLVISKDASSIPDEVTKAGLVVPLVVKPLVVDGTAKSHELFLAYDQCSISDLDPPLVLQEFVNHGGVLFKVYVVGDSIKVVKRFSLPDVSKRDVSKSSGCFPFPRVSCASAFAEDVDLDPSIAELPPPPLLEELSRGLRHRLGLRLFNIDMIRQKGTKDLYYVIDINYFPGFGKMPEYEQIFTEFLLNLVESKHKQSPAAA